jgi:hypothetical protein
MKPTVGYYKTIGVVAGVLAAPCACLFIRYLWTFHGIGSGLFDRLNFGG